MCIRKILDGENRMRESIKLWIFKKYFSEYDRYSEGYDEGFDDGYTEGQSE